MKIAVRNSCRDYNGYRSARVKSLFNAESGANFNLDVDIPVDDEDWRVGLVVGPSGSGKSSIGRAFWGGGKVYTGEDWPADQPIVEAIAPKASFDHVTASLAAVGLGSVPSWLRPFSVLSMGEQFRANLARLICEAPRQVVVDEFTSVVDRQVARVGSAAFAKAWRRTGGQAVLLSCHRDIIEWLEPDWVYDTATGEYAGRRLWRRPPVELEIWRTDWAHWPAFEPHHYLKVPRAVAACCYLGVVEGRPVAHLAMATRNKGKSVEARGCRLVVLPEWQGAGIGTRFLNAVCEIQATGAPGARLPGRKVTTCFHTSHPGLVAALRRDPKWRQLSSSLHGGDKVRSGKSMSRNGGIGVGYGGHFRAIQGFRYYGEAGVAAAARA